MRILIFVYLNVQRATPSDLQFLGIEASLVSSGEPSVAVKSRL